MPMSLRQTRSSTKQANLLLKDSEEVNFSDSRSKPVESNSSAEEDTVVELKGRKNKKKVPETDNNDNNNFRTPRKKKTQSENESTPPKQRKENTNHVQLSLTPSTLFKNLSLKSPIKKINEEKNSSPKKLFEEKNVYQNARKALHSTLPDHLPERENEFLELNNFIKEHLNKKKSGTLYVSGPPGTGKTASLSIILNDQKLVTKFKKIYVNCTSIESSKSIFSRIVKELDIKANGKAEKDYLHAIRKYLSKDHKMILLVLDEIDQLESKNQSVLYTIFEWPSLPNSQIVLIGIANSLDLTDRILPRLQARCELKPKLMHFAPYTKQQIVTILTKRLEGAGISQIFAPAALQMLAGKVAAISGDVRRALDIGRRVIELVEQNGKNEVLKSLENLESLIENGDVKPLQDDKIVELNQVVNLLNNIYGTTNNMNDEEDDSLPLQQKIILCTLLLILKYSKNKDITVGKLHDVYKKVCAKRNILAVDQGEFVGLCALIETRGILRVTGRKEPRLNKVHLEWDQEEITSILRDKKLLSVILQDDSCLGKI